jgi:hypothetical protein
MTWTSVYCSREYLQLELPDIREKLNRSISFLQIPRSSATVFIAGNHWSGKAMVEAKEFYDFGVVHGNGQDLDVEDPSMC